MSESKIARRYARALVDLCMESKNHAVIGRQLETFAQTYASSPELQQALKSPVVSLDDKRQILLKLFAKFLFAPTTRNFLLVLTDAGRIGAVEKIAETFAALMDELNGRLRAVVISPVPIERGDLVRVQAALQRLTGHTVLVEARITPELIGGVVIRIGNTVLDGSVRAHLDRLREHLTQAA